MIRRILRRILRRPRSEAPQAPVESPAPYSPPEDEASEAPEVDLEIDRAGLEAWLADGVPFEVLDIREPYEYRQGILKPSWLIPMNDIPEQLSRLDASARWVVVCAAGMRSFGVAHYMRDNGVEDAWSMVGGLGTWADQGYGHAPNESKFGLGDWVSWNEDGQVVKGRVQWIEKDESDHLITVLPEQGSGLKIVQKREMELKRP